MSSGAAPVSSASNAVRASVYLATNCRSRAMKGRTCAHESRQVGHATPTVAGHGSVGTVEDEADERAQRRFALRSLPHRSQELVLERVHALVDEVLLRREVVEDRLLGDIGGPGDLGDAEAAPAPLRKRRLAASAIAARLLLLPLSKAELGVSCRLMITEECCGTKHGYAKRSGDTN